MNAIFELWAEILPERAMACTFNLEYLLIGGRDGRHPERPYFMWYDWMVGGWGARNGRDGWAASGPVFGVQLGTQPFEGQERLSPVLTTEHELRDRFRRTGQKPRRYGCGKRRHAYARRAVGRVVLLRSRALGDMGSVGRLAFAAARRLVESGTRQRALPRLALLQRSDRGRRHDHATFGRRRRPGRSARSRSASRLRGRGRRLRVDRTRID